MDINCSEKSFKDFAVGAKEFNDFKNKDATWKDPNADKLISCVIEHVYTLAIRTQNKI